MINNHQVRLQDTRINQMIKESIMKKYSGHQDIITKGYTYTRELVTLMTCLDAINVARDKLNTVMDDIYKLKALVDVSYNGDDWTKELVKELECPIIQGIESVLNPS